MKRNVVSLAAASIALASAFWGTGCNPVVSPAVPGGARTAGTADAGLFCDEHGVPEAFCTLCHEELKEKLLLCKEHGDIPEDICTLYHPEVEAKHKIVMCPDGHKLPKHFCSVCAKAGIRRGRPRRRRSPRHSLQGPGPGA